MAVREGGEERDVKFIVFVAMLCGCNGSCSPRSAVQLAAPGGAGCVADGERGICLVGSQVFVCKITGWGTFDATCAPYLPPAERAP